MLTIEAVVNQIHQGKLKSTQLVEEALKNIETHQDLNIFTEVFKNQARRQAQSLEHRITSGQPTGRLAGAIFCVKDNFLYKDSLTTVAAPFLTNFKAPYSATCLQRILDEDAILLGKVNLDAFAHGTSTENSYFGPTKNPHDPKLTPGGSSGGSAVAVATNICHFSLGTDTGGSVRLPASFCGVVGFKPTYGLLSRYGVVAMASSTDCISPLAHHPQDIELLIDILKGKDDLDGTTFDSRQSVANLKLPAKLRVGIIEEFTTDLDDEVNRAMVQASQHLKDSLKWSVDTISLKNIKLALACYYVLVSAEVSSNLSRYNGLLYGQSQQDSDDWQGVVASNRQAGFMAENKRRIMLGTYVLSQGYYEAYYHKAQKLRTLLCQQFEEAWQKYDVLISPVSPTCAFSLGSKLEDPLQMYLADLMTVAPSLAGIPATSLPLPVDGLPVGLQIMTPRQSDALNLKIANKIYQTM